MSRLINRVQLIGRIGSDPIVKNLPNGHTIAKLSLATNESFKNKKGKKYTITYWHNLTLGGNLVKFAQNYLSKGQKIAIDGKIITRNYVDKNNVKHFLTEIFVHNIMIMKN